MNPILERTQAAIKINSKQLQRASSILLEHFNLNNFYYYNINNSGDFFLFDDNSGVVDYLEAQEFVFKHPHYCHPRFHQNSCLIDKTNENPLLAELESTQRYFLDSNFNLAVSIVNKTEHGVEEFGFHSAQSNEKQIRFLFNHIPDIRLFMNWFKESNASTISFLKESSVNLPNLLGNVFYEDRIQKANPHYLARQKFLEALGVDSGPELSPADWSLIKLIMSGYSASQIAEQLYRSRRTIEHRIEALKSKLNCSTKVELIQKAQEIKRFLLR